MCGGNAGLLLVGIDETETKPECLGVLALFASLTPWHFPRLDQLNTISVRFRPDTDYKLRFEGNCL